MSDVIDDVITAIADAVIYFVYEILSPEERAQCLESLAKDVEAGTQEQGTYDYLALRFATLDIINK